MKHEFIELGPLTPLHLLLTDGWVDPAHMMHVPVGLRVVGSPVVFGSNGHRIIQWGRGIAETHGVSVAQIALAWLPHQKVVSSVVVGAKRMDQLEDNIRAVNISLAHSTPKLQTVMLGSHGIHSLRRADDKSLLRPTLLFQVRS